MSHFRTIQVRRRTAAVIIAIASTGVIGSAQQAVLEGNRRAAVVAQAGAVARVALETRVTRGQPYSADAVTEFVQQFADGNRIVRRTTTRLYRDSEGRTRRELVNESPNGTTTDNVVITDPVAGVSWVLNPTTRTVQRMAATVASFTREGGSGGSANVSIARVRPPEAQVEVIAGTEARRIAERQPQVVVAESAGGGVSTFQLGPDRGESNKEDLGEQIVEGVRATGTRTTTVIPAGAIGNEQPLTTVNEQWFSPELGMLVLTRHSDPRVGETTYRLTNIVRSEPDRSLFQLPSDYTVPEPSGIRRRSPQ